MLRDLAGRRRGSTEGQLGAPLALGAASHGAVDERRLVARRLEQVEIAELLDDERPPRKWSPTCAVGSDAVLVTACRWPPNHGRFCLEDPATLLPGAQAPLLVTDCESSQPEGDRGEGGTPDDCLVAENGRAVCLRSERDGRAPPSELPGLRAAP